MWPCWLSHVFGSPGEDTGCSPKSLCWARSSFLSQSALYEFMYSEPLICYEICAWLYHLILTLKNKEHSAKGTGKMLSSKIQFKINTKALQHCFCSVEAFWQCYSITGENSSVSRNALSAPGLGFYNKREGTAYLHHWLEKLSSSKWQGLSRRAGVLLVC